MERPQIFTYLTAASADFSALPFFLLSSVAADDDTLRFFLSLFFFLVFLSLSGSLSLLELVDEDVDELVELVESELESEPEELELLVLLDTLRFFLLPATLQQQN